MRRTRGTRSLPPYVQARLDPRDKEKPIAERRIISYRGWCEMDGRRVFGPAHQDPRAAHEDAITMRKTFASMPKRIITLKAAHEEMLRDLEGVVAAGTLAFYRTQAKAVFETINPELPLQSLTIDLVQQLIRTERAGKFAPRSILHRRVWLNRLVNWARHPQRQWFRGDNPVPLAGWPKPDDEAPDVLTEAEIAAALSAIAAEPEDYDLVLLIAYTGLRRAEVARLHADDVDLQRGVLWVRGKRRNEAAPITAAIRGAVERLALRARGRDGWLVAAVPSRTDGSQTGPELRRCQAIDGLFRRWKKRLGQPRFHAHALRHSLATTLIRRGVAPGTVQRMLRHSTYAMTQRYVHLVAEDLHGAAAQLRYLGGGAADAEHG